MTWETLAPWIAIAFTLALSILVPLFTQIANNNHQIKMQREKIEFEQKQKKMVVYEDFMKKVGAAILAADRDRFSDAGASISNMYIYAPKEWLSDLDELYDFIRTYEWDKASKTLMKMNRLIMEEINK